MQQVGLGGAIKNDMWITDLEESPDPSPLPDLPGFHVLVRPVSVKSVTKGGIFIPDSTRDDMSYLTTVAHVLALGDLAYQDKEKFPNGPYCKEGDFILMRSYSGTRFSIHEREFRLINDDSVEAIVDDPRGIRKV